jgi:hypothetical protein
MALKFPANGRDRSIATETRFPRDVRRRGKSDPRHLIKIGSGSCYQLSQVLVAREGDVDLGGLGTSI